MLGGFFGDLGSFKTATMTLFLWLFYASRGIPVYTNYLLRYPFCEKLDLSGLFGLRMSGGVKGAIGVDEIHMVADSRLSGSYGNLFLGYFVSMSRKLGWDVWYTSQLSSAVDKREFDLTDLKVICLGVKAGKVRYQYVFGSDKRVRNARIPVRVFEKLVYPYYDTMEVIEPIRMDDLLVEIERFDTVRMNERVDARVGEFMGEFGYSSPKEVFKYEVDDWLLSNGHSSRLGSMVTNRVKTLLKNKNKVKKVSQRVTSVDTRIEEKISSSDRWSKYRQ